MAHKYTYKDVEIAYDEREIHSWRTQKALAGADGPVEMYAAIDRVLCGKSDEIADALGDDVDTMLAMLNELASLTNEAKN